MEVRHATKRGKDIPCSIDSWEGDYILIQCEVSAGNEESLEYVFEKDNPFDIKTQEQKKTMILESTGTGRNFYQDGVEIQFDVDYKVYVPENIKVFNQELISK